METFDAFCPIYTLMFSNWIGWKTCWIGFGRKKSDQISCDRIGEDQIKLNEIGLDRIFSIINLLQSLNFLAEIKILKLNISNTVLNLSTSLYYIYVLRFSNWIGLKNCRKSFLKECLYSMLTFCLLEKIFCQILYLGHF